MKRPASSTTLAKHAPVLKRPAASARGCSSTEEELEWSYDRLWDSREISQGWHRRNVKFWQAQGDNLRGMTGGGVSQRDLAFSEKAFSDLVHQTRSGLPFGRALDCGAGIGRVSAHVLRRFCSHIDLVEFVKKHLAKAKAQLSPKGKGGCTFAFHNASMQTFRIAAKVYDLIWCQWLLMYLTDADALDLLRRAREGLSSGGLLIVKENVSTHDKATYFDDADGELWIEGEPGAPVSCVRTALHYEDLFERAGLQVTEERMQQDLGPDTMEMVWYVLTPAAVVNGS